MRKGISARISAPNARLTNSRGIDLQQDAIELVACDQNGATQRVHARNPIRFDRKRSRPTRKGATTGRFMFNVRRHRRNATHCGTLRDQAARSKAPFATWTVLTPFLPSLVATETPCLHGSSRR